MSATASRIAASLDAGVPAGGLSHTRQATQTRGRFTSDGPRAISRTAHMKIARQPGRRLRLFICGEAFAQHKADEDRKSPDHNMRDVGEKSRAQGERRNPLQKNPPVEITLSGQEAEDA